MVACFGRGTSIIRATVTTAVGSATPKDLEYIMGTDLLILLFFWGAMVILAAWQARLIAIPRAAPIAEPVRTIRAGRSMRPERIC